MKIVVLNGCISYNFINAISLYFYHSRSILTDMITRNATTSIGKLAILYTCI